MKDAGGRMLHHIVSSQRVKVQGFISTLLRNESLYVMKKEGISKRDVLLLVVDVDGQFGYLKEAKDDFANFK